MSGARRFSAARLALTVLLLPAVTGCGSDVQTVAVTGQVTLDGLPVPAELQIEQLSDDGARVGRSAAAFADDTGRFTASIQRASAGVGPLKCQIVVRASRVTEAGGPAAFDEDALPEKVVRLVRILSDGDSLAILLTH